MNFKTVASAWYEAVMVGGYGCKLDGQYANKQEAQKAINDRNNSAVYRGYKASNYFIVLCSCVRMIEDNGDVISETITRTRV